MQDPTINPTSEQKFTPLDIAAFWSRVEGGPSFQCWDWKGNKAENGYGKFQGEKAHRVAYQLVHGPIPEGHLVRHRCDNRLCCNPGHLLTGTHADNVADAVEHDRYPRGPANIKAKLTAEQVDFIRRNPDRLKQSELARRFGIAESTVSYVRSGATYKTTRSVPPSSPVIGRAM